MVRPCQKDLRMMSENLWNGVLGRQQKQYKLLRSWVSMSVKFVEFLEDCEPYKKGQCAAIVQEQAAAFTQRNVVRIIADTEEKAKEIELENEEASLLASDKIVPSDVAEFILKRHNIVAA